MRARPVRRLPPRGAPLVTVLLALLAGLAVGPAAADGLARAGRAADRSLGALVGAGTVTVAPASAPVTPPTSRFQPVPPPPPPPPLSPEPAEPAEPGPRGHPLPRDQALQSPPAAEPCDVGAAAGATHVVVVRSSGSRATVRACSQASGGGYVTDLGPFDGYVGRSGVTSAGSKREGDGATPAGVYPLRSGFGVRDDPGLAQGWSVVDDADVLYIDDPASSMYNTRQRKPSDGRWSSAEDLRNSPAYDYAQVIGYNEGATPGAGSAIFLHVATGGPTAGCVSLPQGALLEVLRWQGPGARIVIS